MSDDGGSCRSPSRFATNSLVKSFTPVALPPGRLRLASVCCKRRSSRPSFRSRMPFHSGNITGVVFQQLELAQKQVDLLMQAF
jgi:hypothetical protein